MKRIRRCVSIGLDHLRRRSPGLRDSRAPAGSGISVRYTPKLSCGATTRRESRPAEEPGRTRPDATDGNMPADAPSASCRARRRVAAGLRASTPSRRDGSGNAARKTGSGHNDMPERLRSEFYSLRYDANSMSTSRNVTGRRSSARVRRRTKSRPPNCA